MERIIQKLLSYTWSHIYDIHAVFVSLIVLGVMFLLRKRFERILEKYVAGYIEKKPELCNNKELYLRRSKLFLVVIAFVLSIIFFALVALISPFVTFSFASAVMSGVYILFEYAVIKQLVYRK